jgi:hypothetical protein
LTERKRLRESKKTDEKIEELERRLEDMLSTLKILPLNSEE